MPGAASSTFGHQGQDEGCPGRSPWVTRPSCSTPTSVRLRRRSASTSGTTIANPWPRKRPTDSRPSPIRSKSQARAGLRWPIRATSSSTRWLSLENVFRDLGTLGRPIPNLLVTVPITDAGGPTKVVERLVHLSKYHSIIELDNFDKSSPLRGKLVRPATCCGLQTQLVPE